MATVSFFPDLEATIGFKNKLPENFDVKDLADPGV
jgi:hypothetical protein